MASHSVVNPLMLTSLLVLTVRDNVPPWSEAQACSVIALPGLYKHRVTLYLLIDDFILPLAS